MKKILKVMGISLSGIFVIFVLFIIATCPDLSEDKLINISQTLTVYDNGNRVFATFNSGQDRQSIPYEKIPASVKNALIATEDVRFFEHNGIDVKRIAGAMLHDVSSGSLKEGASTITQQLVKNSHLTNKKTFLRKGQEAILALQLERKYSKEKILEMYLNYVYFGRGAYGIEMAAKKYFGISAEELSTGQAATLVGLLKAPNKYAPHINMEKSVLRRNNVLEQMCKYGYISAEEKENCFSQKIEIIQPNEKEDYGYYTDYVLEEGAALLGISVSDFMGSGYSVYTALDSNLQDRLQEIFADDNNFPEETVQGAAVVLDNDSGGISALIGGREHEGMRVFNRATARRQPGSTIKPILVYAPAFENNTVMTTSMLEDCRKNFDGYSPTNFRDVYYGRVTVRDALALSLNVPAVELLLENGIEYSKSYAEKMGITFDENDIYPALALGGMKYGASVLDIAGAYRCFANYGEYSKPWVIQKIIDNDGKTVYSRKQEKTRAIKESTAYLITDILLDVSKQSGNGLSSLNKNIACKTGTVGYNDIGYSDAWCASYSAEHTVCVWMGCDKTNKDSYLKLNVTGSTFPSKIARKIYEATNDNGEFHIPDSVKMMEVDGFSLTKWGITELSTEYTLQKYRKNEVFSAENLPTESSEYWNIPKTPEDVSVQLNELRQAEITFNALQSYVDYRIIKNDGEIIQTVYGQKDSKLSFTDENYSENDFYRILPEHRYVLSDGKYLQGAKSKKIYLH